MKSITLGQRNWNSNKDGLNPKLYIVQETFNTMRFFIGQRVTEEEARRLLVDDGHLDVKFVREKIYVFQEP